MFFSNGRMQLGRAVSSIVELAVEINFTSDAIRIITHSQAFSSLDRIKHYSDLMSTMRSSLVYEGDRELFDAGFCVENVATRLLDGEPLVDCELRLTLAGNDSPIWYSARFLRINHTGKFDGRAILVMSDIEHHKEIEARAAELSEWVEHDPLTGLYNKKAAQTLIDDYLSGDGKGGKHTLLFCDLDDFKSVNDTLGHPFGDALLSNISDKFSITFRREDILCRIGGDEFVILMKNTSGRTYVSRRADLLLERMKQAFQLGSSNVCVTMSIGIASYPECGETYAELLRSADKAMYTAKNNGKNQYCFCEEATSENEPLSPRNDPTGVETRSGYRARGKISDYIFNCLYESTDLDKTLPLVLQLMGTHFGLGRVSIAEIRGDSMNITRQWNASGVKALTQPVEYTGELRALFESSRSGEYMSLRYNSFDDAPADVRGKMLAAGIDDVRAFLHCPLLDDGVVRGYIAFFDCQSTRVWSDEERDTLSYVSRLLSLFVFKQQAHTATLNAYRLARNILSASPVDICVIDPDSYHLLYTGTEPNYPNKNTSRQVCYKAIYGFDQPCDFCPVPRWISQGRGKMNAYEFFSPALKEWVLVSANEVILENGRKACLCGRCITTNYKKRETELEIENAILRMKVEELSGGASAKK